MNKNTLPFIAACLGMFLFGIVMLSVGTINTYLITKFQLNNLAAGSLASLLPFGILLGSLVFGPVVDRYGYKLLLIVCTLLIVFSILLIAYTETFRLIQLGFLLIGFSGGAINGGTNALGSDVSLENKSAKLSLLGVFYGIGALALPLITGALSEYIAYQSIILGIGLFLLLPVIYYIAIPFPPPKQQQGIPLKKVFAMFKDKVLILFAFVLFFQSAAEGISNNWTTNYLVNFHHLSDSRALFSLTLLVIGMTGGRLILSVVLRNARAIRVFYASCLLIIASLLLISFSGTLLWIRSGMVLLGMGLAAGFPVMLAYVGERYAHLSGIAFSFSLVIALLGNTLMNLLVGFVSRTWGIQHYISILIAAALVMLLLASLAYRENKRNPLKQRK